MFTIKITFDQYVALVNHEWNTSSIASEQYYEFPLTPSHLSDCYKSELHPRDVVEIALDVCTGQTFYDAYTFVTECNARAH